MSPKVYVNLANEQGWQIAHVLDTHIHADHLSRSRQLSVAVGAELFMPEQERVSYAHRSVRDGDVLSVGAAGLRAIRTPGHTGESTCYLLDGAALFTGDTLFTEGVGRPDLEASSDGASSRAAILYDSLQRILNEVPKGAVVLPGHTSHPAPFNGRVIGETLTRVRESVDALSLPKDTFVKRILDRIPPSPAIISAS